MAVKLWLRTAFKLDRVDDNVLMSLIVENIVFMLYLKYIHENINTCEKVYRLWQALLHWFASGSLMIVT